ncbi:MAG: hypothetical protein EOP83_01595 [Verrucomicrobiaceae bacterium]|nr:MAG: hypothetical protein EOP83_01595 [Verrucomicrobiaceae bacterium]
MRLTVSEVDQRLCPSSPFARSCIIDLTQLTGRERNEILYGLFQWCAERWGATVTKDAASKGDFPATILWFQAQDRFWFRDDNAFFEFKLRWYGADVGEMLKSSYP